MMVYIGKLKLEILINSMRYVCYNFFLLNIQVEIENNDLYLYVIVSQIFELL